MRRHGRPCKRPCAEASPSAGTLISCVIVSGELGRSERKLASSTVLSRAAPHAYIRILLLADVATRVLGETPDALHAQRAQRKHERHMEARGLQIKAVRFPDLMSFRGKPLVVLAQQCHPGISLEGAYGHPADRLWIGLEVRQLVLDGASRALEFFIDKEDERDIVFDIADVQNLGYGLFS